MTSNQSQQAGCGRGRQTTNINKETDSFLSEEAVCR